MSGGIGPDPSGATGDARHGTRITVPPIITGARVFLGTGIAVWTIGVISAVASIWRNSTAIDPVPSLQPITALLVWRATLLSIAIFSYRGTYHRLASARWLTVGLAVYAFYLGIPVLGDSWRALNGDYRAREGLIAYASAEEGGIALLVQMILMAGLVVLVRQLAAGRNATRFFAAPDQTERNDIA